jgi:Ca-activated chloride channel family protein
VNPRVANIVEKISAFKLQTIALQEAQAGNVAGATQKLKQAATQLLNLGENELAQAAAQEAQNLQQQGQMSSAGTKRLHYETRKLTQG